jgi:hypothetical protein
MRCVSSRKQEDMGREAWGEAEEQGGQIAWGYTKTYRRRMLEGWNYNAAV